MIRPVHAPLRTLAVLLLAPALSIPGCSSDRTDGAADINSAATRTATDDASSTGSSANLPAFCAAGETINARTAAIAGPEDAVAAFTELDPTLDVMLASAPSDVADAAAKFVSTARSSVESGDFSPFEDGTVDALVKQFDAVCAKG